MDVKDSWGYSLHVEYDQGLINQKVTVRSVAADNSLRSWDDITASRSLPRKKSAVAKDVLGKAKDTILDSFKSKPN